MFSLHPVETAETMGAKVEICEYPELKGSTTPPAAEALFFMKNAGVRPKSVRLTLNRAKATLEPGALYRMQGDLELETGTGGGVARGLMRAAFSGETFFQNKVSGTGEVILEPDWGHFVIVNLEADAPAIIVERGMFCAAVGDVTVSASVVKNAATAVFGGEGLVQTKVEGEGVVILNCPVPWDEVEMLDITEKGKVSVDGTFSIMRTEDVAFRVEKSAKTWIGSAVSGEGLLQTFSGSGIVWIAPTLPIYQSLEKQAFSALAEILAARSDRSG